MSRTGKGERIGFEFMRIAPVVDGGLAFHAQPNGAAAVSFPLVRAEGQSVTFENPAHDYPARMRYWREGEKLMAEIEGMDGAGKVRWRYSAAE